MKSTTDHLKDVLPTDAEVAFYREHGFWLSGFVLPAEVLDDAHLGMERFYAGQRDRPGPTGIETDGWRPAHGDGLRKNDYASLRIDELAALVAYPAIGAIAARLSGAGGIRLWHDQLLYKPIDTAGRPANVGWHTDRQYWETCTSRDMLTAWVPFHDVDEQSGSITFIDKSHHWDVTGLDFFASDLPHQEAHLTTSGRTIIKIPAALERGRVSFHHCRTIHGSGPNHGQQPRQSLAIHLQPADNRYQSHSLPNRALAHHRNDDLCRPGADGLPDYTDPALFPVLWPTV